MPTIIKIKERQADKLYECAKRMLLPVRQRK